MKKRYMTTRRCVTWSSEELPTPWSMWTEMVNNNASRLDYKASNWLEHCTVGCKQGIWGSDRELWVFTKVTLFKILELQSHKTCGIFCCFAVVVLPVRRLFITEQCIEVLLRIELYQSCWKLGMELQYFQYYLLNIDSHLAVHWPCCKLTRYHTE